MALKALESSWRKALIGILRELTEDQMSKLLFSLDKIPQGVKADKSREDIANLTIEHYGTQGSITVINREMKLLPRNDAAVQDRLRPIVERLKKQKKKAKERKNKPATRSDATTQKPAAGLKSEAAADSSGSSSTKPKPAAGAKSEAAAEPSGSSSTRPKPAAAALNIVHPDTVSDTQTTPAAGSSTQPTDSKGKADPVGAVKPKKKTEKQEPKPAEPAQTAKAAPVQTGTVTILKVKTSNKTNTHLEVAFGGRQQKLFVTTRLLANAFDFKLDDDFIQRFSSQLSLTAEAKIQGNKITEIKKM